jgi:hypothetical protein
MNIIFNILLLIIPLINVGITFYWAIQADCEFNEAFKQYYNRQEDYKLDWKYILMSLVIPIMFNTIFMISFFTNSLSNNLFALLIFNAISLVFSYFFKQFQSNFGYVLVDDYNHKIHKQIKVDNDKIIKDD